MSCKALQDQGSQVHGSHKVIRCMEDVRHGDEGGVPALLCRRCGAYGSMRMQDLRHRCKGHSARGRAVYNCFCVKKVHPIRKTRIVGVVAVQMVGVLPPDRAVGKWHASVPCEASAGSGLWDTVADQAFEEVDAPPLVDVWEAELEAISEFLEWEEM